MSISLAKFATTPAGRIVSDLLADEQTKADMAKLSRARRSPVRAVDARLAPGIALGRAERHHIGRMVRDRMAELGWRPAGARDDAAGWRVLTSGAIYEPIAKPTASLPRADGAFRQRLADAQALVRSFSRNDYGVDDFIRDKRADAARKDREAKA